MAVALFSGENLTVITDGPDVDSKTGEFHTFSATPTNFAIESNAIAADHIVENPDGLEISCSMSNLDEQGQSYGNRAATFLDSMRTLIKARGLYEVVTRHRIYPSMAMVNVLADHISPFAGALRFRLIFQEIPRATLERATVPESMLGSGVRKTASTQTDGGRVEAKEPTQSDRERAGSGSVLSQILRGSE
jgi:hypothetical protein